jgi:hypothetical protein
MIRASALLALLAMGCAQGAGAGPPRTPAPGDGDDLPIAQVTFEPGPLPALPWRKDPPRPERREAGPPIIDQPDAPAPTTGMVIDGGKLGHDPQVAAGERFLIVYTAHGYQLRDKATGRILAGSGDDEIEPTGSFNTLFAPLWSPRDKHGAPNAANINLHLRFAPGDPMTCDPENATGSAACVREFYDTRILWDEQRKRFWIESAARNHLWFCELRPRELCDQDPKWSRTQPRRFIAVAVSRTEDPRQGFHRYILVDEYADWPKIGLHDRYLILGHRASPKVYVFDADKLAAGNPDRGPVRVARLDASSFPGARFIGQVNHHGPTGGATFLVGTSGSDEVIPFALWNPDPLRAAPPIVVAGPTVAIGSKVGPIDHNAVYRNGRLYLTWNECAPEAARCEVRRVRVVRLPVQPVDGKRVFSTKSPAYGYLDVTIGGREPDDAEGSVIDYTLPALDVNAYGAAVIVYARRGHRAPAELPSEVRYSILYHDEDRPRPGVLLRRGTTMAVPDVRDNVKAGIDLAYAQVDPSDDRTVWVSHAYADASVKWFKQVVAAVRP